MILGLEISRHDCAVVLADALGQAQFALRQNFAPHAPPATQWLGAMNLARDVLHRAALEPKSLTRVGLGFDSRVSGDGLLQKDVTRPGWEGYDLARGAREHLALASETAVFAAARVLCQGLGEAQFGALRGAKDWLFIHLDATLESALCLGGIPRLGAGGDIGGLVIERDGALDSFGRRGTLRAYCSGEALSSRARSYGLTLPAVADLWTLGDSNFAAQSLIEDFTARLAQGLAGAVAIATPQTICLGGDFASAIFEPVRGPLASKLRDLALPQSLQGLSLVKSGLGADAGSLGAVALALNVEI